MDQISDYQAPPLKDRVSFLVHRINAHLLRITKPKLKVWGVDLTEARLLSALLEGGAMPAGDIVRLMALPQSTISHQLKRLEERGYLTRTADLRDSRIITAELTQTGRQVANETNELSRDVAASLARAIGVDDIEKLRIAMKRIDAELEKADR